MRLYFNPFEAFKEVERDVFEMGIEVQVQTMQDKVVGDDPEYKTKEVRAYGFKIVDWKWDKAQERKALSHLFTPGGQEVNDEAITSLIKYIEAEFWDRTSGKASNPGMAYHYRREVWDEFLHHGRFAYTYSERIAPQFESVITQLQNNPDTRQGIITVHSNIQPETVMGLPTPEEEPSITEWNREQMQQYAIAHPEKWFNQVRVSADCMNMGGTGRIPCSLHYQIMQREGKLDLIYCMRSCDLLTHFGIDVMLALRMQNWMAVKLQKQVGTFTYFTGSLHAYQKDLKTRGIF